jgi:hypothetical protein
VPLKSGRHEQEYPAGIVLLSVQKPLFLHGFTISHEDLSLSQGRPVGVKSLQVGGTK